MTTQKTFKQRVRARSAKTGESYTAARAQLLRRADAPSGATEPTVDAIELTGVSEEAMRGATGRTIGEWLEILDAWGAREQKHTQIARWLVSEHGIPGWWAQNVTVGYERARGMRVRHQEPGGFSVSVSRTISASGDRISDAFTDGTQRARWLPDAPISIRTANRGRSARFDWGDPPSRVGYNLFPKGEGRTQIGLAHEKLPDADAAARMKAMWRERLTALKALLEPS
ncbi:MAG: DUF4287 domain-containing protein [Chloroflexi bacterium]|nr:DUF4287 domain-containing protein [Chloroflexota bacterium]